MQHEHPVSGKNFVTKTQASAARSASGGRAAGCEKILKATAFVPLAWVTILALLTHKTYRDFRYGFLTSEKRCGYCPCMG